MPFGQFTKADLKALKKAEKKLVSRPKRTVRQIAKTEVRRAGEPKQHRFYYTGNPDYNGTIQELSLVPQGDNYNQREGVQLRPTKLHCRFHIGLGAIAGSFVRLIIFRWHPSIAATGSPVAASILDNTTPTNLLGTSGAPMCPQQFIEKSMYSILHDKTYVLDQSVKEQQFVEFNIYGKKLGGKVKYTGTSTNSFNGIFMLALSDLAVGPAVTLMSELHYKDL